MTADPKPLTAEELKRAYEGFDCGWTPHNMICRLFEHIAYQADALTERDRRIAELEKRTDTTRDERQTIVAEWCVAAFGAGHASSIPQRGIRHAEEAIETAQAAGCERTMLHKLVDYVFDRPAGELGQEIGGSGLTLLALAQAAGLSADRCEQLEIARVKAKSLDHFAKRNRVKNEAGFNVSPPEPQP